MKNYYLGLDIGTNSVGYAVTDSQYELIKFKGEPMWGSHVFEEGSQSAERRGYRTARRRLDRRQQRVDLVQEIFAEEIGKIDERFFIRLKESHLYREDTSGNDPFEFFNDKDFSDKDYYEKYPTIHHLITELIENKEAHDIRFVYMAAAWLVAHRGHFLNEVDKDNIEAVLDFNTVYGDLIDYYVENESGVPWNCSAEEISKILLAKTGVKEKEKRFASLFSETGRLSDDTESHINLKSVVTLLSGGTADISKLFPIGNYEEKTKLSFKGSEDDFEQILAILDDDADFIIKLKNVYDWSLLFEASGGSPFISKAKVGVYEQHKKDLEELKAFVKKYIPGKYDAIFRTPAENNYVAYSYNFKSVPGGNTSIKKKATQADFCDFLKKAMKDVTPDEADEAAFNEMMSRISNQTFMPKQITSDNRVIPYQLYYHELKMILENASDYLTFLSDADSDGYTAKEKLLSIMTFRIPYYVGPLHSENSSHAWIERKAEGRIRPWNFDELVDHDASENEFINRMLNKCSYLPGENVLPKNSLMYCKFEVLNEINNIKINGAPIDVECKQGIFDLFKENKKVTVKKIRDYLKSNNYFTDDDVLSGIDITVKSSLRSYHDFRRMLENKILTEPQVESIIKQLTYTEDKARRRKYLKENFPTLSDDDVKYISKLKCSDFGRLSGKFLDGIVGSVKESDHKTTIMKALWETNDNLMKIIFSEKYDFKEQIEEAKKAYYEEKGSDIELMLSDMYVSNAVKRPIYRTLDIVKDVKKACGCAPEKIFVEMARGGGEKGKRSVSRRDQILELYKHFDRQEVRELDEQLSGKTDNELQSEVLFLYFMQLGRCMYSGKQIDINQIKNSKYVDIDHIYPQAYVKDDSLNNKVLVFSELNGEKSDRYPIKSEIRNKMHATWTRFKNANLISDEKYYRLTRSTGFTEDEKQGFINRQLVETRQSTKAVASILNHIFPDTEIVYVKAGLVSDFKNVYGLVKSRSINDLHHAKDAYLNIVCGNVYHSKFTSRFFSVNSNYSIKTTAVFGHEVKLGDEIVWEGESSIARVKKIVSKNNIHYTRFAFFRKGGLFDQMPLKAAEGLIQRKNGLDTAKYGGYNKSTASFFLMTKYAEDAKKKKPDIMIVPIDLMVGDKVRSDKAFAEEYVRGEIASITNKPVEKIVDISFPLGLRPLKVNTRFSFDGFESCLTGKSGGGKQLGFSSMMPLVLNREIELYIKNLERYETKRQKNPNYAVVEKYDGLYHDMNVELYKTFTSKIESRPYSLVFSSQLETLKKGMTNFEKLSIEEQSVVLMKILSIFKTGRAGGCDLKQIGGSPASAVYLNSSKLSNWTKGFKDVRIVDVSASGLFKSVSGNILELL